MCNNFSVDSSLPTAYIKIKEHLSKELKTVINNRPIIILCIGSDRSTGDSLGPLIGYKLKSLAVNNIYVYGTLENPVHAKNLSEILNKINLNFINPYIIAIDSCLGSLNNIGKIFIKKGPLFPGLALNKDLPSVGEINITGIVNISGNFEFLVLQNTRLYTVMKLADSISRGIYYFTLDACNNSNSDNIISFNKNNYN
ncbi:spore protease YyaC [uncultured Clostridium sp.]|uniref:spore protease YyaC n=1 Tax=uncultured Clostridium sp. TaxID=59620 RepID=UPI0025D2AF8B|nr:spore protease YyaC [uncultured Clostridium sp.]